jgi:hypothetical protein
MFSGHDEEPSEFADSESARFSDYRHRSVDLLEFIERAGVTFRGKNTDSFGDDNLQRLRIQVHRSLQAPKEVDHRGADL